MVQPMSMHSQWLQLGDDLGKGMIRSEPTGDHLRVEHRHPQLTCRVYQTLQTKCSHPSSFSLAAACLDHWQCLPSDLAHRSCVMLLDGSEDVYIGTECQVLHIC